MRPFAQTLAVPGHSDWDWLLLIAETASRVACAPKAVGALVPDDHAEETALRAQLVQHVQTGLPQSWS